MGLTSVLVDTQASSIAGIITAVGTLVTAVGAILIGYWQFKINSQVRQVHKIVNQDKTDRDNFNRALVRALEAHGVAVPIDQSLADAPVHDPTAPAAPLLVMEEVPQAAGPDQPMRLEEVREDADPT